MYSPTLSEITSLLSLISNWAHRPDAATDLKEIFNATAPQSVALLSQIKSGDFSWIPEIQTLPTATLDPSNKGIIGAYSRENTTIYLSIECPATLLETVLLEEIGHHIDALFNEQETPGDEGTLFSAAVRGEILSEEQITAILNEDDSSTIHLHGRVLAVECAGQGPGGGPSGGSGGTTSNPDTINSAVSTTLPGTAHYLIGTGSANITLTGNSLSTNYLQANSGNTTLIAGTAATTKMVGGAGNTWLVGNSGTGTDVFNGGTGSSTMVAGNGSATLTGGSQSNSLTAGNGNQSLYGGSGTNNTLVGGIGRDTLRAGTGYNTLTSGSGANGSNTLIGGGVSSILKAGAGNDSLSAGSGRATLLGGTGIDTLFGGTGANSLQSGSTVGNGNLLIGSTVKGGTTTSNTLVAGLGHDTIIGGTYNSLLLVTPTNQDAFASDVISLTSGQNTLGLSGFGPNSITSAAATIGDSLFAGMAANGTNDLQTVQDLATSSVSNAIILGANAQAIGVSTLVAGFGSDTMTAVPFTTGVYLNGSQGARKESLIGGAGNDTFIGSKGGFDVMLGGPGNDLFIPQSNNLGTINGGTGSNTLQMAYASSLTAQSFNSVLLSNVPNTTAPQTLLLGVGVNSVSQLQTSGINDIVSNYSPTSTLSGHIASTIPSNATLSGNVVGYVSGVTGSGSNKITLTVPAGAIGSLGFVKGQILTGNGILSGTTVTGIDTSVPGRITLGISLPIPSGVSIAQGSAINGWIDNMTLDGSRDTGLVTTAAAISASTNNFVNHANAVIAASNSGAPNELMNDTVAVEALQNDPSTYIQKKGDILTAFGTHVLLNGAQSQLPDTLLGNTANWVFTDSQQNQVTFGPGGNYPSLLVHQVIDNTLISGMYGTNTLNGGSGTNLYQINNIIGYQAAPGSSTLAPVEGTLLPYIINNATTTLDSASGQPIPLQSGSTIQFTGNSIRLKDASFINVSAGAAQKIITGNGNNSIWIGTQGAKIGINTIIGGNGADTFLDSSLNSGNVFLDGSKGSGNQLLSATGNGNNTLLAGSGNATLLGGDGNNSLIGGLGNNSIHSGIGNSTLDGGYGISTLQADGGTNLFVIRNRYDRILSPDTLNPETGSIPLVGTVNTYVNFDPLQGNPVSQFSPAVADNSPAITKSPSFASADLSNFYNLQNFNLLETTINGTLVGATYGVGNALDNSITSAAPDALILGMGGNNTLVASGSNSTLYGDSYSGYVSPDLFANAPINTVDQAFVDGVFGQAGNNSLVANGAPTTTVVGGVSITSNSWLDGGPGYNDGFFDSGANTLVGTGGFDTVIQTHQGDSVSLGGSSNELISSVDIYQLPDNVSRFVLDVTAQSDNSGQVTQAGQRMTAGYAAVSGALGVNTNSVTLVAGSEPSTTIPNSDLLEVQYGTSDGTTYGSSGVNNVDFQLNGGAPVVATPDPVNTGSKQVTLSWSAATVNNLTLGYLVEYQEVYSTPDSQGNTVSPWLTYLNGSSNDLAGTSTKPSLIVNNLPSSQKDPYSGKTLTVASYNFKVTAQQTVLPAYTDANGVLQAKPVSLIGGQGNDVIYGGVFDWASGFGNNISATKNISNTRPVLTNNPIDPASPGTIPTPAAWAPTSLTSGLFPTYLSGGLGGNDYLYSAAVQDRSGKNFQASEYINGGLQTVTYSGLNTLVGGQGSDTFVIQNGGTGISTLGGLVSTTATDLFIKYGNETPAGQNNLVISVVPYLMLSDTLVSQGQFVNQAEAAADGQFVGGNRLDNTLSSYGFEDTLMGGVGRDSLYADLSTWSPNGATLIGGTAYGLDNIAAALNNYVPGPDTLNNNLTSSIYRDTDPVPASLNGAGAADPSQYWLVNGLYDPNRNSDTLVALNGSSINSVLDGGAGADSMVGGTENDTFYVSAVQNVSYNGISLTGGYGSDTVNSILNPGRSDNVVGGGDVLIGGGGNDTVIFTGSDIYWSGITGATSAKLEYELTAASSISNLILQPGDPVASTGVGNASSTGSTLGGGTGSNFIEGNSYKTQFSATESSSQHAKMLSLVGASHSSVLNGAGVGGNGQDVLTAWGANWSSVLTAKQATAAGFEKPLIIGNDTLTGVGAATTFIISTSTKGATNYTTSASDTVATIIIPSGGTNPNTGAVFEGSVSKSNFATDEDYALITDFTQNDKLVLADPSTIDLNGTGEYLIGSAPHGFGANNLAGGSQTGTRYNDPINNGFTVSVPDFTGVAATDATSQDFGIYWYDPNGTKAPNLVAEIRSLPSYEGGNFFLGGNLVATTVSIGSGTATVDGGLANNHLGGVTSQIDPTASVQGGNQLQNFLGTGAFYNLTGSSFASHVSIS